MHIHSLSATPLSTAVNLFNLWPFLPKVTAAQGYLKVTICTKFGDIGRDDFLCAIVLKDAKRTLVERRTESVSAALLLHCVDTMLTDTREQRAKQYAVEL